MVVLIFRDLLCLLKA